MNHLQKIKRQLAGGLLMLALSVPLLLVAMSNNEPPSLAFQGVEMEMQADGSVQVLVEVSIRDVENTGNLPAGARFSLNYNREYLTLSNFGTNEALGHGADALLAFQYNPKLYQVPRDEDMDGVSELVPAYPFAEVKDIPVHIGYNRVNQNFLDSEAKGHVIMNLVARRDIEDGSKGIKLMPGTIGTGSDSEVPAFDQKGNIVLGTLSFRIEPEDVEKLPEISQNFDGTVEKKNPKGNVDTNKRLLWYEKENIPQSSQLTTDWSVVAAFGESDDKKTLYTLGLMDNSTGKTLPYSGDAISHFTFNFPRIIIGVDPVEPELTVDAYQAYTTGHITAPGVESDLDIVLQKYSPAVLVKYSDGTQGNEIFPWGRIAAPWTASVVTPWEVNAPWGDTTNIITDANYDPTGDDYKIQKLYCYTEEVDGVEVQKVFPIPVSVHLTVTPITLVDVTANDLYRVYPLNNALVGDTGVRELSDLSLPEEARLITDVPAGGATLAMAIPGWSHINTAGDGTTPPAYWPVFPAGGGSPDIGELWKDGATDGTYHHWPVREDLSKINGDDWGTADDNGAPVGQNRAGLYTFHMARGYGQEPVPGFTRPQIKAAYPWLTVPDNEKNSTVNGGTGVDIWPLDDALRRIVWAGDEDDKKLVDRERYVVTYQSTKTNYNDVCIELLLPDLTLRVEKRAENNMVVSLPDTSLFRLKMPDGTEVRTGIALEGLPDEDWFIDAGPLEYEKDENGELKPKNSNFNGYYTNTVVDVRPGGAPEAVNAFDLTLNPGKTDAGIYALQRERLLRYINLGGWFSVSINEDPETHYWSDFIPVYVPPRKNVHLEDKIYNFIGKNADLYHFANVGTAASPVFPTTVTLPAGRYEAVDASGVEIYDSILGEDGQTVQVPHEERYGVKTLYSGITGSQFGELNTFSIEPAAWSKTTEGTVGTKTITRYGANEFKHDAHYGAYNWVHNPGIEIEKKVGAAEEVSYTHNESRYYTATIRTQNPLQNPPDPDDPNALREGITLTYEGPPGGVTDGADGNVDLVTFDTRIEGYTVRQEYTLVITNVGDIDIYGLSIDMLTDHLTGAAGNPYAPEGGNFTLLKPPASFLPAGERTTFTLSYVYDLRSDNGHDLDYLDKLYITSDNKHTVGPGTVEGKDYLLNFDAQFKVTGSKIHRVFVQYNPSDGCMGTAQVIVGDIAGIMNTNAGSSAATMNSTVYVMATPTDEYEVRDYRAVDSNGSTVSLVPWTGTITLVDGTTINIDENSQIRIWSLTMPDYDVTVTIDFYEPVSSKLRLSDLKAYASATETDLYENNAVKPIEERKPFEYAVWQKSFTDAERKAAEDNRPDANVPGASNPNRDPSEEEIGRYLMRCGTAVKKGYDEAVDQYLVVVPFEADYAQIEATLRQVPFTLGGQNPNLPRGIGDSVEVEMTWFPEKADHNYFYTPTDGSQVYIGNGDTSVPTTHTSRTFPSPTPKESNYVRIRVSYTSTGENATRYYFVELHRVPKDPIADLNYGNSPYGMIMNATNIAAADKAVAKKAFVDNKYSFDGLAHSLIPLAVTEAVDKDAAEHSSALLSFDKLHYWTEAWVAPDAAYEPESHMGFHQIYDSEKKIWTTWVPDENIYKEENNLDLSDTSFFAILGEPFQDPGLRRVLDSTGRPARIEKAVLSLEVYILDTTPGLTQAERFALPADPHGTTLTPAEQAALQDRTITLSRRIPAGSKIDDWSYLSNTEGNYLRPGRYQLVYTLPDYDYDDYIANTAPEDVDPNRAVLKVTRDFVVLAPVGDVNSDLPAGEANAASHVSDDTDEALVKGRITEPLGYTAAHYSYDGAIFKLRTCDVNNDRNINNIDANTIRVNKCVKQYYLPVDYKK